jgi:DNA repair photolyase
MVDSLPNAPRKGRGAVSNRTGRYEAHGRVAVDDGWEGVAAEDAGPPRTTVAVDASRSVIARNASPDVPFDRSINPYRGCEHGCVYCFARPTHAFLGLSPGLDFETRLFAKPEAARLLEAELARPSYRPAVIALGTSTDPYQPLERRLGITRQVLEVLRRARHPVAIVTKSNLVERDIDILADMAGERLAEAGVPVGVLAAPMIPARNDPELEAILEAAAGAGADTAGYVLLRLPLEIKDLFAEWLAAHFPDRRERVLNHLRGARGGRLYEAQWGARMKGRGPYAALIKRRFELACDRLGLDRTDWELDASRFARPRVDDGQLALF